jgi:hypothetical protein
MNVRFWEVEPKFVSALVLLMFLLGICAAAQAQSEQLAQQSSDPWLTLVDSGKYAESWQQSSRLFKAAVTREQWQSMLRASRDPLGKMLSRKLRAPRTAKRCRACRMAIMW